MFYMSFCQKKFCVFRERKYISVGDKKNVIKYEGEDFCVGVCL